jgi:hypothetical protein
VASYGDVYTIPTSAGSTGGIYLALSNLLHATFVAPMKMWNMFWLNALMIWLESRYGIFAHTLGNETSENACLEHWLDSWQHFVRIQEYTWETNA